MDFLSGSAVWENLMPVWAVMSTSCGIGRFLQTTFFAPGGGGGAGAWAWENALVVINNARKNASAVRRESGITIGCGSKPFIIAGQFGKLARRVVATLPTVKELSITPKAATDSQMPRRSPRRRLGPLRLQRAARRFVRRSAGLPASGRQARLLRARLTDSTTVSSAWRRDIRPVCRRGSSSAPDGGMPEPMLLGIEAAGDPAVAQAVYGG